MGVLTNRATDIVLTVPEFCEAMGYLATPGRMLRIEAQVPYGKDAIFQRSEIWDLSVPSWITLLSLMVNLLMYRFLIQK